MSAIKVDSISARAGTGTVSLPSGNNLSVAGNSTLTGNTNVGGNLSVSGNLTVSGTNNIAGAGSVLETLTSLADGSTVTVGSGTYTFQNVTAVQNGTTSYEDLTGSTISYKPPIGTTKVIYEFIYQFALADNPPLGHHKFFIDSVEVTNARWNSGASGLYGMMQTFKWVLNCNAASDVAADGSFTSWNALKQLKIQAREYGTGNECQWHATHYWDGATSEQFHRPVLTITAIK